DTAPPAAYRILCLRFDHLVHRVSTSPPWTQDSIRVGGSPLPDRDFHPARDAKLFLARERFASLSMIVSSAGYLQAVRNQCEFVGNDHEQSARFMCNEFEPKNVMF